MSSVTPRRLWPLLPGLLGLILALEVGSALLPNETDALPESEAGKPLAGGASALDNPVAAILARPLFDPTRHRPSPPATPQAAAVAATEDPKPSIERLIGIVAVGRQRLALLALTNNPKPVFAKAGDVIGDTKIDSIGNADISVTDDDGTHKLAPTAGDSDAAPAAAAPASDDDNSGDSADKN